MEEILQERIDLLDSEVKNERDRLSTDRMDISFGELINLYKNNELIIRPDYQRLFRWSPKQKTALIESILLSIPIPPIFVAEDKDGIWELVDGLQRVSTFLSFFGELNEDLSQIPYQSISDDDDDSQIIEEIDEEEKNLVIGNKWELEAGGLIKSLEGFNIDTLPSKYKINLKRAVCRVEILRGESNISMKYELFKRLNAGGSKLTPQEIRNALYRGNPEIINLLFDLSRNHIFQKYTALSKQKKQELYDQELILRFIAFYGNTSNINENTENFLNSFMENAVRNNTIDSLHYKAVFEEVMSMIDNLNDEKVFRNSRNSFVPAYFEGILIGLAQNIELYRGNYDKIKNRIDALKDDDRFKRYSGTSSNSRSRIRTRLKRVNEIFSEIG